MSVVPPYAPWRRLDGRTRAGWSWSPAPLVGGIWDAVRQLDEARAARRSGCSASCRPSTIPEEFLADLPDRAVCSWSRSTSRKAASAQMIAGALLASGNRPERFAIADGPGLSSRAGTARRSSTAASAASTPRRSSTSSSRGLLKCPMTPTHAPVTLADKIRRLQGPILVLGASGFVGANLMRSLLAVRQDVYGTTTRKPAWRLEDLPDDHVRMVDLLIDSNLDALLDDVRPRTIFNCVAYGAYSFETDSQLIYRTNFQFVTRLLPRLWSRGRSPATSMPAAPRNTATTPPGRRRAPDRAQQRLRRLQGRRGQLDLLLRQAKDTSLREPAALLGLRAAGRLVTADPQRDPPRPGGHIPGVRQPGGLPRFRLRRRRDRGVRRHRAQPDAGRLWRVVQHRHRPQDHDRRGRGDRPASCSASPTEPSFTMPDRRWDVQDWYANIDKARERLGWEPRTSFRRRPEEDRRLVSSRCPTRSSYQQSSKKFGLDTVYSVSAIVACYKDNQAIPIMYERLKATFTKLNIDFEIIFVNDCSPDDTEEVIRASRGTTGG